MAVGKAAPSSAAVCLPLPSLLSNMPACGDPAARTAQMQISRGADICTVTAKHRAEPAGSRGEQLMNNYTHWHFPSNCQRNAVEEEHGLKRKQKPKIMKKNPGIAYQKACRSSLKMLSKGRLKCSAHAAGLCSQWPCPRPASSTPKGSAVGPGPCQVWRTRVQSPHGSGHLQPCGALLEPAPAPSALGWHRAPSRVHGAWQQSGVYSRQRSQSPSKCSASDRFGRLLALTGCTAVSARPR